MISVWSLSRTPALPFFKSSTFDPMASDTRPNSSAVTSMPPMETMRDTPRTRSAFQLLSRARSLKVQSSPDPAMASLRGA